MMETTTVVNDNDYLISAKNCTFIWKISNFTNRCKAVGEKIVSPMFTSGDLVSDKIEWQLHLFPFGNEDENKNYLSVYLACTLSDEIMKCSASIKCDIWNNVDIDNHKESPHIFERTKIYRGYRRFIYRYSDKMKNYLASSGNNTLRIVCSIRNIIPTYYADKCKNHRVELIRGFDSIFLSGSLSDITIEVDNKTLKAHKIILSARSDVFSAMFQHNTVENSEGVIRVKDISYNVMKEVLRFIYCGTVENLDFHKKDLLAAATKYNLVSLKNCCEEAFWKDFSIDNICEILNIADLYQCKDLKTGAMQFIIKNIRKSFETSEFFELVDDNPYLLTDFFRMTVLKESY